MDDKNAETAVFQDIHLIADQERRRLRACEQEPTEIQILRLEAAEDAKQMLAQAAEVCEAMREEARQEGYEQGKEEGYAAGLAAGLAEMALERDRYRADIQAFVNLIEQERRGIWENTEPQIVAFVMEIAKKVIKDHAEVNRDVALSIIRNALRRITDTETIRIRVNLADLDTVRASREDLIELVDGIDHLDIVEDRRVSAGGCVVETSAGAIDAKLETQFTELDTIVQAELDGRADQLS